jgi:hypothetical protein
MATGRIGATPVLKVRWSKLPTTGTTVLSGLDDNSVALVYDAGYEAVYRNGVLLSRGNDYTATNGTTVTLIDATLAGDVIEIFANDLVPLTDAISKGQYTAKGALLSASAASTPGVVTVGANDTVLTADSSTATGLKWATPAAGGMTLISETVASSLSSLSFSSLGSYKQLLLVWAGIRHSTTGSAFSIRFNNNSGSIYPIAGLQVDSSVTLNATSPSSIQGSNNITIYAFGESVTNAAAGTDVYGSLLVDNYTSATKSKYWEIKNAYYNNAVSYGSLNCQGLFNDTTAITSLDIVRLSGSATFSNQNNTTIRLYGVS